MTAALIAVAAFVLCLSLFDLVTNRTFARLALRNISRRPGESVLVVVGCMLGTAIIAAALIVGASFDGSITDRARTRLGPIDERILIRPASEVGRAVLQLEDHVAHQGIAHVDGIMTAITATAVLDNGESGTAQRIEPFDCSIEFNLSAARRFGDDPEITGIPAGIAEPNDQSVILNAASAERLGAHVGDRIVVHLFGQPLQRRVAKVLPAVGLAGYCGAILAQGTAERAFGTTRLAQALPPAGAVFVSNTGGVFDSGTHAAAVFEQLKVAAHSSGIAGADADAAKADLLERAVKQGATLRDIFLGVGGFSIVSGILLLVNLVVMLAEERMTELGIMRAIGLKRLRLVRSFSLEGSMYAGAASIVGALVGIAIGALVVWQTQAIYADRASQFRVRLFVPFDVVLTAAVSGFAISALTILGSSARIARMNVISAIRELPSPRSPRHRTARAVRSGLLALAAAAVTMIGIRSQAQVPLVVGVPILAHGMVSLYRQFRPWNSGRAIAAIVSLNWTLAVFVLFRDIMSRAGMEVFLAIGLTGVANAVVLATELTPATRSLLTLSGRSAVAARLALAYPLARKGRTALLLGMFSLVVFTIMFLSSLSSTLRTQVESAPAELSAGFDALVDTNQSSPLDSAQLTTIDGVADAAIITRGFATWSIRYAPDGVGAPVSGFDSAFLLHGTPVLKTRLARYADDRSTFEAVLGDPSLVIVSDTFLLGDGPREDGPKLGDRITVTNGSDETATLKIVGILRSDHPYNSAFASRVWVEQFLSPAVANNRAYVSFVGPTSAGVRHVQQALIEQGAEVRSFPEVVDDALSGTRGFLALLRNYLSFGLVIGVAGLGVVMTRAVRERRREIAMLKAMGVTPKVILRAFLGEAAFIAVQGVAIGTTLALVTAYQVVVKSDAFSLAAPRFAVRVPELVVLALIPLVGSLLAAAIPARQAARVPAAEALRVPG
jgi:putative ABC transport system permease protein